MALIEELKTAIRTGRMPPIFKHSDLSAAGILDPNYSLANYNKLNSGSSNKNQKVLVSRIIDNETYYAFYSNLLDVNQQGNQND